MMVLATMMEALSILSPYWWSELAPGLNGALKYSLVAHMVCR
jgi:hypothetical protein